MRCRRYSNLRRAPSCSLAPALVNSPGNIGSITQDLACSVALTKRQLWEPQESWRWRSSKKWDRDRNRPEVNAMIQTIRGIHHVTAIAIDPQANIDFYTQVVGLRLVKDTVNFDDPGTYHFYYGDKSGHPGTILTFFPFVSTGRGRSGSGMVDTVAFAAPAKSLDGWMVRLAERGVDVDGPFTRFSRPTIGFRDPDGLKLEIAAVDGLRCRAERPRCCGIDRRIWVGDTVRRSAGADDRVADRNVRLSSGRGRLRAASLACGKRQRRNRRGRARRVVPSRSDPGPARWRNRASHRVSRPDGRGAACLAGKDCRARLQRDACSRPSVFSFDLFSRAGRDLVRDCDRSARICCRRGSRPPRHVAQAPALARAQTRRHTAPIATGPASRGGIMNGLPPDPGGRALHQGQPIAHAGAALSRAKAAMLLLHGRGASAEGMLSLAEAF